MSNLVTVQVTVHSIYVDDDRIIPFPGNKAILFDKVLAVFKCNSDEVIYNCLIKGFESHVSAIDKEPHKSYYDALTDDDKIYIKLHAQAAPNSNDFDLGYLIAVRNAEDR